MELEEEIISLIQERGLREMLHDEEQSIQRERHQRRIQRLGFPVLGSFVAVAAAILLLIVLPMGNRLHSYADGYSAQLEAINAVRGEMTGEWGMIGQASAFIAESQYEEAEKLLQSLLTTPREALNEADRDYYDQADWLLLITEIKQNQTLKAHRHLRKIAHSESSFNTIAESLL